MGSFFTRFFPPQNNNINPGEERRPVWKAKSVLLATVLLVVGGAQWAGRASHPPAAPPSAIGSPAIDTPIKSSQPANPGLDSSVPALKPESPALFRFGSSYVGGFFIGMAIRRFLKWSLIAAGVAGAAIVALQKTGVLHLDWPTWQAHIHQSLGWLQGHAEAFEHFLTGYLPSAGAGATGIFMGRRH